MSKSVGPGGRSQVSKTGGDSSQNDRFPLQSSAEKSRSADKRIERVSPQAKSAYQNLLRTPAAASVVGHGQKAAHSSLLADGVPLDGFDSPSKLGPVAFDFLSLPIAPDATGRSADVNHGTLERPTQTPQAGKGTGLSQRAILDLATKSPGSPPPSPQRRRVEELTGRDLGGVRIHLHASATAAADAVDARAFTVGPHIFFSAGEYRPGEPRSDELLTHELIHTQQQPAALYPSPEKLRVSQSADPAEIQAQRLAQRALAPASRVESAYQNLLRTPAAASVVGHGREAAHSSLLAAGVPRYGFDRRSKPIAPLQQTGHVVAREPRGRAAGLAPLPTASQVQQGEAVSDARDLTALLYLIRRLSRTGALFERLKKVEQHEQERQAILTNTMPAVAGSAPTTTAFEQARRTAAEYAEVDRAARDEHIDGLGEYRFLIAEFVRLFQPQATQTALAELDFSAAVLNAERARYTSRSPVQEGKEKASPAPLAVNRLQKAISRYRPLLASRAMPQGPLGPVGQAGALAAWMDPNSFVNKPPLTKEEDREIREKLAKKFPVIADPDITLRSVAFSDASTLTKILQATIDDRLSDIEYARAEIVAHPEKVWLLDPVLQLTLSWLNIAKDPVFIEIVNRQKQALHEDKRLKTTALFIAFLAGTLFALEMGIAATLTARTGQISAGTVIGAEAYFDYKFAKAASQSALDRAWAISAAEPSLIHLALAIVGTIADLGIAIRTFREVVTIIKGTADAGKLATTLYAIGNRLYLAEKVADPNLFFQEVMQAVRIGKAGTLLGNKLPHLDVASLSWQELYGLQLLSPQARRWLIPTLKQRLLVLRAVGQMAFDLAEDAIIIDRIYAAAGRDGHLFAELLGVLALRPGKLGTNLLRQLQRRGIEQKAFEIFRPPTALAEQAPERLAQQFEQNAQSLIQEAAAHGRPEAVGRTAEASRQILAEQRLPSYRAGGPASPRFDKPRPDLVPTDLKGQNLGSRWDLSLGNNATQYSVGVRYRKNPATTARSDSDPEALFMINYDRGSGIIEYPYSRRDAALPGRIHPESAPTAAAELLRWGPKGPPTSTYFHLLLMRRAGVPFGGLRQAKLSTVIHMESVLELAAQRALGVPMSEAALRLSIVRTVEARLVLYGHRIRSARIDASQGVEMPLGKLLGRQDLFPQRDQQFYANLAKAYRLNEYTKVLRAFDIILELVPAR
jgi:hypothetical protein